MAVAVERAAPTVRSALDLARAIRAGETSARDVVEAHIERLRRVQPRVRALAAERFDAARAEADAADRLVAEIADRDALPPLLGVPCTIKESIAVRGMPNCAGLVARRAHRAETTAPAAQRLFDAGAIALGVTNTSEMTMWIESVNHVYGRTNNAYDLSRTAGGSSGGEGAAIGTGGAPIGLGSDIGGSIRLPAFFNGVFGHKPSPGLVPDTGQFPVAEGEAARMLTIGPLARRAGDLMPVTRLISGPDGVDPQARDASALGDPAEVRVGDLDVILAEGTSVIPVSRELREARERAADVLQRAGARVRRERLKGLRRAMELYLAALQDGSPTTFRQILASATGGDVSLRRALGGVVRRTGPHTAPTVILLALEATSARIPERRLRRAIAAGRSLRREVEALLGDDGVILHPPHPRVAPRHGRTVGRGWVLSPTATFNLLELPVTQVPLGLNRAGLPLGVQVVAACDRDHVAIACALELERAFGGWVPPRRLG